MAGWLLVNDLRDNAVMTMLCHRVVRATSYKAKKMGQVFFLDLSQEVNDMVQNSNQLIEDLKLLADILAA